MRVAIKSQALINHFCGEQIYLSYNKIKVMLIPTSMRITRHFLVAFAVCVFVFGGPATAVGIKIVRILSC